MPDATHSARLRLLRLIWRAGDDVSRYEVERTADDLEHEARLEKRNDDGDQRSVKTPKDDNIRES